MINATHTHTHMLGTYNPNLIELILKPMLMYLNVFHIFRYWRYLWKQIQKVNATQYNSTNALLTK